VVALPASDCVASVSDRLLSQVDGLRQIDLLRALDAVECRESFARFVFFAWPILHGPDEPLIWNGVFDAICDHLQAVADGKVTKLIINIPPGFAKSLLVSVFFQAWMWCHTPRYQQISISAADDLAARDQGRCHKVIESEWYQRTFRPTWKFDSSQDAKGFWMNTAGGVRLSRPRGKKITGLRTGAKGAIMIDDPLDASDAFSDKAALNECNVWFRNTLLSRRNIGRRRTPIVIIMQRLHEADLSGVLLAEGGWDHLCIPMEYDGREQTPTSIGWVDWRHEIGEPIHPDLATPEVIADAKKAGSWTYACQYQQLPAPGEGALVKREWIEPYYWMSLPQRFDALITSWDCTFKKTSDSDMAVGQLWGCSGAHCYLIDQFRAKANVSMIVEAVREMTRRHPEVRAHVVEAKAMGPNVVKVLQSEIPGIKDWDPQGTSKEERLSAVLPMAEAGQVHLPHPDRAQWVRDALLPELYAFPLGRHDDQVDALSQALLYLRSLMRVGGSFVM
jgi:predicted phage terminase large subunit-like protein